MTQNSVVASPTCRGLSTALETCLSENDVETIANEASLLAEARVNLPAFHRAMTAPAGREGVMAIITRAFVIYPQPQRTDAEWDCFWLAYTDVLRDVPMASLRTAMTEWMAKPDASFLPKPGEILALARTVVTPESRRLSTARAASKLDDERVVARRRALERMAPTPEERERVRQMAAETVASLKSKIPKTVARPHVQATVDEYGVSAELRAKMRAEGRLPPREEALADYS